MIGRAIVLPEAGTKRRRSIGGTLTGALVVGHLLGGGERERDWGFWESLRKEKAKEALADGGTTVPMG